MSTEQIVRLWLVLLPPIALGKLIILRLAKRGNLSRGLIASLVANGIGLWALFFLILAKPTPTVWLAFFSLPTTLLVGLVIIIECLILLSFGATSRSGSRGATALFTNFATGLYLLVVFLATLSAFAPV